MKRFNDYLEYQEQTPRNFSCAEISAQEMFSAAVFGAAVELERVYNTLKPFTRNAALIDIERLRDVTHGAKVLGWLFQTNLADPGTMGINTEERNMFGYWIAVQAYRTAIQCE